jgi:anti-anti-sigma factor
MAESDSPATVGHQPTALAVTVDSNGDGSVVTVRGEIDLDTSAELGSVLDTLDTDAGPITLDLGEVTYIDSTGLRVLLTARDAAVAAGGDLRVSATSSIVARLIEITGATELLDT